MSKIPSVSVTELLDAGVHFGHKTARWNPKMAPYIYGVRDDIHIIDLQQTAALIKPALTAIYETVKKNGKVLFVSTKIQATEIVAEYAEKCGQHYVNHRWLGGTLTNWVTISRSIKKLDGFEKTLNDQDVNHIYTKKEILDLSRKKNKLLKSLGGIRSLGGKPDLIVIIDTNKERLAIDEAKKLDIPLIAVVDTNSSPDDIQYPIPGNDDAIRSIRLYCKLFAEAALAGIEDGLSASGVDIGAAVDHETVDRDIGGVTRMKPTKKISKASAHIAQDSDKEEFESGLKNEVSGRNSSNKKHQKSSGRDSEKTSTM